MPILRPFRDLPGVIHVHMQEPPTASVAQAVGGVHVGEEKNSAPVRILPQIQPFSSVSDPVEIGVSDQPHVPRFPGFRPVSSQQPDGHTRASRYCKSRDDERGDETPTEVPVRAIHRHRLNS